MLTSAPQIATPRVLSYRRVFELVPDGRRFIIRAHLRPQDIMERRLLRDEGFLPWTADPRVWERAWISDVEATPLIRSLLGRRYVMGLSRVADRDLARIEMRRLGFGPTLPVPVCYRCATTSLVALTATLPMPISALRHR